ncbi:hypothetical protein [Olleya sp. ITB9]|jgi:hypothetical protein|uniref:hypothetical protein n=1 Tax=Olleya sp. ITB9 TaxID=1715648 RepID=UPI00048E367D|nr:hypothetical protein [Olleya sp. ITB9]
MEATVIFASLLFVLITFVFYKLTSKDYKKDYSKKMWSNWVTRLYYWQGALLISGGLTVALLFALKSVNILQF